MTILEVLVASFIGIVVVASAFELYLTQHQNWLIQDEITDAQQAARASIRMLSRHIRLAGFGLPSIVDALEAVDSNPDTLLVVHQPAEHCEAPLQQDMTSPSEDLQCNGYDLSCFTDGQWAFIYDPDADSGEFFVVTGVQTGTAVLEHATTVFSRNYPQGSQVCLVEAYRFFIDASDSLHPVMMVEQLGSAAEPYAENIEDLQFRYVMLNGDTLDVPNQVSLVRQVLIDLTARTNREDLQFTEEYRRREFATKVQVRNLGF